MTLTTGATLQNGRYTIQSTLTEDIIEISYTALDNNLGQIVIIKTLKELSWIRQNNLNVIQHFNQKVATYAKLNYPQLVSVVDGFDEYGIPFLVLQPIRVKSLVNLIQSGLQRFSLNRAIALLRPFADVLHSLHQSGIFLGKLNASMLTLCAMPQSIGLRDISLSSFLPCKTISTDVESPFHDSTFKGSPNGYSADTSRILEDIQGLASILVLLVSGRTIDLSSASNLTEGAIQNLCSTVFQQQDVCQHIAYGLKPPSAKPVQETVIAWFQTLETLASDNHPTDTMIQSASAIVEQSKCEQSKCEQSGSMQIDSSLEGVHSWSYRLSMSHPPSHKTVSTFNQFGQTNRGQSPMNSTQSPTCRKTNWRLPILFGSSSLVAVVVGGYLGFSFRLQEPEELERSPIFGREIFGTEQLFPQSEQWPGRSSYDIDSTEFLFEQRVPESIYVSPSELDDTILENTIVFPDVDSETESIESEYELSDDIQIGTDFDSDQGLESIPSMEDENASVELSPTIIDTPPPPIPSVSEPPFPQKTPPTVPQEEPENTSPELLEQSPDIQSDQVETTVPAEITETNTVSSIL